MRSAIVALAMLLAPPAVAQDAPDAATPTIVPAPPIEPADLPDPASLPGANVPSGVDPAAAPEGTLVLRGEDTMLAARLGSVRVFSGDSEIGDVEQIILSRDGRVVALVVGVGGFLGLGEKPVGIRYERLDVRDTEDGIEFTTDLTRDELMNTPAYTPRDGD